MGLASRSIGTEGRQGLQVSTTSSLTKRINDHKTVARTLGKGDVVSEAALYFPYFHQGDVTCITCCNCLAYNSRELLETLARHTEVLRALACYAHRFASAAKSLLKNQEEGLFLDFFNCAAILEYEWSISPEARLSVARLSQV